MGEEWQRAQYIARGLLLVLFFVAGAAGLCCWKGGGGVASPAEVEAYRREQVDCSQDGKATTRAEVDACRAASRARFCGQYPESANCHAMREGGVDDDR